MSPPPRSDRSVQSVKASHRRRVTLPHQTPPPSQPPEPIVDRPWHVTQLLWSLLLRTLAPPIVGNVHDLLVRFVAHIKKAKPRSRPRQLDMIASMFSAAFVG